MDYSSKAVMLLCKIIYFAYRCIVLGEHRPLLADLLWTKAQSMIKDYERVSTVKAGEETSSSKLSEKQI